MEDRGQAFPNSRANKVYYASPGINVNTQNHLPTNNVFANTGYGFSNTTGLGHPGNNNNLFNQLYMNNMNDNFSSSFPLHQGNYLFGNPQWQPPIAVPKFSPHPQSNAQLGANVFNAFSVNHLQTRNIPPVVTDDNVEIDAEQPSTSSCAFPPRPRDTIPIYQARVCFPMLGKPC